MNCFVCHQGVHPDGTHYGIAAASGICQHCGIAVCRAHSHKAPAAGAPPLPPADELMVLRVRNALAKCGPTSRRKDMEEAIATEKRGTRKRGGAR